MPVSFCDVTSSTAPVATAASMALPPRRRISSPASAASGSLVATMPWRASTSDRPCDSQPCARDPGTALIVEPGCGTSADGTPNGCGDCAVIVASATSITTAAVAKLFIGPSQIRQKPECLRSGGLAEKLLRQPAEQLRQRLAVQRKGAEVRCPREFKASRHRRHPDLSNRRIGRNHELRLRRLLEHEVEHPVLQLDLEALAVGERQQGVAGLMQRLIALYTEF